MKNKKLLLSSILGGALGFIYLRKIYLREKSIVHQIHQEELREDSELLTSEMDHNTPIRRTDNFEKTPLPLQILSRICPTYNNTSRWEPEFFLGYYLYLGPEENLSINYEKEMGAWLATEDRLSTFDNVVHVLQRATRNKKSGTTDYYLRIMLQIVPFEEGGNFGNPRTGDYVRFMNQIAEKVHAERRLYLDPPRAFVKSYYSINEEYKDEDDMVYYQENFYEFPNDCEILKKRSRNREGNDGGILLHRDYRREGGKQKLAKDLGYETISNYVGLDIPLVINDYRTDFDILSAIKLLHEIMDSTIRNSNSSVGGYQPKAMVFHPGDKLGEFYNEIAGETFPISKLVYYPD